jgi:hypothetical protein
VFPAAGEKARPLEDQQTCTGCHASKGAVDNTFVQFYPGLVEAAKRNKTWRE